MARTNTNDALEAGAVIDNRYQVVGMLGSGGFANVYRAKHVHLDREVALKVLHPPLTNSPQPDAPFARRFEQEAKIAAALDHPNIVGIFDYGFLPTEEPYIAMAYLDGHDLEDELEKSGRMTPRRAVKLMQGCLEGVAHGHARSVVHKDLKPSNLYLVSPGSREERLVVLDFGIARVFNDPGAKITQSGLFSGTPAYLAPEYIREQTVSPAVDVYQLGLILIEMLTGRPAVEADGPMGYLLAHCMGRLNIDPRFFETDLGKACQKAIAINPDDRYQTAAEFADALEAVEIPESLPGETLQLHGTGPISHDEVAAFAQTLPESVLADTSEWSKRTAEPNVTPGPRTEPADISSNTESRVSPSDVSTMQQINEKPPRRLLAAGVILLVLIIGASVAVASLLSEPDEPPPEELGNDGIAVVETTNEPEPDLPMMELGPLNDPGFDSAISAATTLTEVAHRRATGAMEAEVRRAEEQATARARAKKREKKDRQETAPTPTTNVEKKDPKPDPEVTKPKSPSGPAWIGD